MKVRLVPLRFEEINEREAGEYEQQLATLKEMYADVAEFLEPVPVGGKLPENADANGAYNIARKGLLLVERIKGCPDEKLDKVDLKVTNLDWMKFAQR